MKIEIIGQPNGYVAQLIGRLDAITTAQADRDMQVLIDHADKAIVLDCEQLQYISSSGLRLFLALRKAVEMNGGSLVIVGLSDQLRQVFTITGFINLFDIRS